MNRNHICSWLSAYGSIVLLALVGACASGDQKSGAYAQEAWAYFKKMCDEKSGEKIYQSLRGVKNVVVTKPLPPATEKDLFDQYWFGDPYSASATSQRSVHAAGKLVYPNAPIAENKLGAGLEFVELELGEGASDQRRLLRISYDPGSRDYRAVAATKPVSRFALQWQDISTSGDRKYWVAASRLSVIDLSNNTLVAERIGYFIEAGFGSTAGQRRPWLASKGPKTTCPYAHDWADRWFVLKVLGPGEEAADGK